MDGRVVIPKDVIGSDLIALLEDNKIVAVLDAQGNSVTTLLCEWSRTKIEEYVTASDEQLP